MTKIKPALKKLLENQHYAFTGEHSAVKICEWTKQSLRNKGHCYKQKFYGISTHRCCQITPSIGFCTNSCIFCWRPIEYTEGTRIPPPVDDPKEIVENSIKAQQKLLIGFKGNNKVSKKKLEEAMDPDQFAISLSGEPTLYPKLPELIREIRSRDATSFLVTNGLQPSALKKLIKKDALPTNLYISLDAPDQELFRKIDRSLVKDAWNKLNNSLEIMSESGTTTVLRITVIKGLNDVLPESYAGLIEKAKPDFVEVKAYMWVGYSRQRLEISSMPMHSEIKDFSRKIIKHLSHYNIADEKKESRVVLLKRN